MAGSELEDCDTLCAEVMIISREDENLPSPAVLPLGVSAPTTGVTMQESVAPLIPSGKKSLGVYHSPVNAAALPSDNPQKKPLSSLPLSQDIVLDTNEPSSDFVAKSLADEDSLLQQTPVKVPKKRGRKSKAELLLIKAAQELEAQTFVENRQSDSENVEVELTPSGRPRRRAAKTAMKHFQDIVDEWEECGLTSPPKLEKKLPEDTGKKQRRKRKRDDSDDDMDFVVSDDILEQEEEVEDVGLSEEESDNDLCFNRKSGSVPGEVGYKCSEGED
ncbi:unnamed protein product, partial [Ranitomeya imitator]